MCLYPEWWLNVFRTLAHILCCSSSLFMLFCCVTSFFRVQWWWWRWRWSVMFTRITTSSYLNPVFCQSVPAILFTIHYLLLTTDHHRSPPITHHRSLTTDHTGFTLGSWPIHLESALLNLHQTQHPCLYTQISYLIVVDRC